MTQMKQTKNFRTLATLSNHNTTVPPMNSIRESEPQICNSNAAKFVTCDKIDPSDVHSSTDDNYSGKGVLERLRKKYLQYSDDVLKKILPQSLLRQISNLFYQTDVGRDQSSYSLESPLGF
jgi:hypothetical protein